MLWLLLLGITIPAVLAIETNEMLFEGDMVINQGSIAPASADNYNPEISYVLASTFSEEQVKLLKAAMSEFEERTCISFEDKKNGTVDFINILHSNEKVCISHVGVNGAQNVLLHDDCFRKKALLHQFMHILGFYHEHTRPDRDDYIQIIEQNIQEAALDIFKIYKEETVNLIVPYAIDSVLHFPEKAFSKNGQPTMAAKIAGKKLGAVSDALSSSDVLRVNKLYGCYPENEAKLDWKNEPRGVIWANGCEFKGKDLSTFKSTLEECKNKCYFNYKCSTFSWKDNICHLKKKNYKTKEASPIWNGFACGIVTSHPAPVVSESSQFLFMFSALFVVFRIF